MEAHADLRGDALHLEELPSRCLQTGELRREGLLRRAAGAGAGMWGAGCQLEHWSENGAALFGGLAVMLKVAPVSALYTCHTQ